MSTKVTPKISKKNKWWISENRHMELRYFCLQYKEWMALYNSVKSIGGSIIECHLKTNDIYSLVEDEVIRREVFLEKMKLVEKAAEVCDEELWQYIFKSVTEGYRYEYLRAVLDIPCGRRQFYERLRKFYWILDKLCDSRNLQIL